MKTMIITIALSLLSILGVSQNSEYVASMCKTLPAYKDCSTAEDFKVLGNTFKEISLKFPNEWLAFYYHAHCYIVMSLLQPQGTPEKENYLNDSDSSVKKVIEIASQEADAWTLLGMFYTARVLVNPNEYGRSHINLSNQAIEKAMAIEPANPRAKLLRLQNKIGEARYFGLDIKEYCPEAESLLKEWDNYTTKSPMHPSWGKEQAAKLVAGCNL